MVLDVLWGEVGEVGRGGLLGLSETGFFPDLHSQHVRVESDLRWPLSTTRRPAPNFSWLQPLLSGVLEKLFHSMAQFTLL